jgi:hypothetical protein
MTRDEHLEFCKICVNRKKDMQRGLVCSLTNEIADFDEKCLNYVVDEEENKKVQLLSNEDTSTEKDSGFFGSWKSALLLSAFGFIRAAMHGFHDLFGILFLILGIGWLVIALVGNDK